MRWLVNALAHANVINFSGRVLVRFAMAGSGRWSRASSPDYAPNDCLASMAKRTRKFTQACSFSAEPQSVELHELGFVEFDRDPRPQSVNIVSLTTRRHGNGHDFVSAQIEPACCGFHGSVDHSGLRACRCGQVVRGRPLYGGSKLVDMG
jgi:hypothetical protein